MSAKLLSLATTFSNEIVSQPALDVTLKQRLPSRRSFVGHAAELPGSQQFDMVYTWINKWYSSSPQLSKICISSALSCLTFRFCRENFSVSWCTARVINRSWTFLFWVSNPKVLIALGVLVFLVYCYDHNNATRNNYANSNATLMIDFSAGLDE